jgi:hypothetical protein
MAALLVAPITQRAPTHAIYPIPRKQSQKPLKIARALNASQNWFTKIAVMVSSLAAAPIQPAATLSHLKNLKTPVSLVQNAKRDRFLNVNHVMENCFIRVKIIQVVTMHYGMHH